MREFKTLYDFDQRVRIDGGDVVGKITGFQFFRASGCSVEVAWWHNGSLHTAWVDERRLSIAA